MTYHLSKVYSEIDSRAFYAESKLLILSLALLQNAIGTTHNFSIAKDFGSEQTMLTIDIFY